MLKPYSFRKEFLLTLIAGSTCATTMHYVLIQPEHFEESVNVFALIGLLAMCGKWLVFPARAAQKEGNKLLSVSVAVVWVCLISVAEIFTSGAYSNISEISPWSGVIGVALVSPFMVKILAMSDETFREIYGYVPKYNEPESNARLVFAPVFAVLGALLVTNWQMSSIVTIFLPAQWLIQQDAEKEFYRHQSIWPQLILIATYLGLWGYTLGYLNNI